MKHLHNICGKSLFLVILLQSVYAFSQNFVPGQKISRKHIVMSRAANQEVEDRPINNAFINILGDGSIASLNYERLFLINPERSFITAGLGIGANSLVTIHANDGATPNNFPVVPHHITGNIGKGRHFLEFGLGGAILGNQTGQHYLSYLVLGYRLQPLNSNRVSARIFGSYPLQRLERFDIIYIPAGISVGWAF